MSGMPGSSCRCRMRVKTRKSRVGGADDSRWNKTLRQRLARFVRKTLSFSKSDVMHEICLRLFLYRYNLSLRPT